MSAAASDGEVVTLLSRLRDALIETGRLTPEGALRIDEAMRTMGLEFGDAALRLGLLTPEDLVEAAQAARKLPPTATDGIFEGALHRMSFNRNLPVKYVGKVAPGPSIILVR